MVYEGKIYIPVSSTKIIFFNHTDTVHDFANTITLTSGTIGGSNAVWFPKVNKFALTDPYSNTKLYYYLPGDTTADSFTGAFPSMSAYDRANALFYDSSNDQLCWLTNVSVDAYDPSVRYTDDFGWNKVSTWDGTTIADIGFTLMRLEGDFNTKAAMVGDVLYGGMYNTHESYGFAYQKILDSNSGISISYVKDSTNNVFYPQDGTVSNYLESFRLIVKDIKIDPVTSDAYYLLPYYTTLGAGDTTSDLQMFTDYSQFQPKIKKYVAGVFDSDIQLQSKGYTSFEILGDGTDVTQLWATCPSGNEIDIYSPDSTLLYTLTDSTHIISPARICMDDTYAYVGGGDRLTVINKTTRSVVRSIAPALMENVKDISWDGTNIWVLNFQKVWKIDTTNGNVLSVVNPTPELYNNLIYDLPNFSRIYFESPTVFYLLVSSGDYKYAKDVPSDRIIKYTIS